jgi:glutamate--cysteine ligase catalytic subunit
MDDLLATHFAHLFIRDPLVVFATSLESLELNKTDHFELLQSTNWQTVRFKPPPSSHASSAVGWRVEFRSMEVQITDFENAAFAVFMVLLAQTILHFNLNLYIPIVKVDENMITAHSRNAVLNERFHFRTNLFSDPASTSSDSSGSSVTDETSISTHGSSITDGASPPTHGSAVKATALFPQSIPTSPVESEYELMSVNEIVNGQSSTSSGFPGLIPLVQKYSATRGYDVQAQQTIDKYLELIAKRANGTLWTTARWFRHLVQSHPQYERDSVVDDEVAYDLLQAVKEVTEMEWRSELAQPLLGGLPVGVSQ